MGADSGPGHRVRTAAAVAVAACFGKHAFGETSGEKVAVLPDQSGGLPVWAGWRSAAPPNRDAGTAPVLLPQERRELHSGLDHARQRAH